MKNKRGKHIMATIGLIIIMTLAGLSHLGNQSENYNFQSHLKNNRFEKCSEKPNCVNSFAERNSNFYISSVMNSTKSQDEIIQYLKNLNCSIQEQTNNYHHYVCVTNFFKFRDDLELLFRDKSIYFRSQSRVGHSDLGKNRDRINKVKDFLIKNR